MRVDVKVPAELTSREVALWLEMLEADQRLGSPFLTPHFVQTYAAIKDRVSVAVLSEPSEGQPCGFFPYERGLGGAGRGLALGLADRQAIVARRGLQVDVKSVMRGSGLSLLRFDQLLADQHPWFEPLPSSFVTAASQVVNLQGGFENYLAEQRSRSRGLFQSTARKLRKLENEHGSVRLEFDERDHAILDQLMAWKSAQYRRTGRRDRFAVPHNRRLLHLLMDVRESSFSAPLTTLRAGGRLVAAHFGLRLGPSLSWWFPVYDPAYAAYSPGLGLCLRLVQTMPEHGLTTLELGKGDESYKARFANDLIELLDGAVAPSQARCGLHSLRRWPAQYATGYVLERPALRRLARSSLSHLGALRTQKLARARTSWTNMSA